MKQKICVVAIGMLVSGVVLADCPAEFNAEQMIECLTIEGSDVNYQEWKKNFAAGIASDDESDVDSSIVSPLTGEDIRTISPAAGKPADEPAED